MPIPADTNEMGCFQDFVSGLLSIYGRGDILDVLVHDSGMNSESNARFVDAQGLGYVAAIKGNQPELEREARRLMSLRRFDAPDFQTPWQNDSSRGRIRYQFYCSDEMAGWATGRICGRCGWCACWRVPSAVCRPHPHPRRAPVRHQPRLEPPLRRGLPAVIRAHWRIENEPHGTLDLRWLEDRGHWVRRGQGLPVCALLPALAFNLLALLRAVHLRSDGACMVTGHRLRDWMRDALVHMAVDPLAPEVAPTTL